MLLERINEVIEPAVVALGFELLGCEMVGQSGKMLLRIYVDKSAGVTIDDCAAISRQVGAVLDVEDPFSSRYLLEVSSPGVERPLFKLQHYQQCLNQAVKFRLHKSYQGRRNFHGVIREVDDEEANVTFEVDGGALTFSHQEIEKASLVIEF